MTETKQTASAEDTSMSESQDPQVPLPPDNPYVTFSQYGVTTLALNLANLYSNFPFGSLAIILVGPHEYRFDVHKDVICEASEFFKAAFEGKFIESHGIIRVPEQEVTTFKLFIRWVYSRRLRGFYYPNTKTPSRSQIELEAQEAAKERHLDGPEDLPWDDPLRKRWDFANYHDLPLLSLTKLYILADALQAPGLQYVLSDP